MPELTPVKYGLARGTMTQNFSTARESDSSFHGDTTTSNNYEVIEFFRNPINEETYTSIFEKVDKYWNS